MTPDSAIEAIASVEARSRSSEDNQLCGCKVILPDWQAVPKATEDCSLGNAVGCLLIYESFVKVAVNSRIEHSANVCEQTYSRRPEF